MEIELANDPVYTVFEIKTYNGIPRVLRQKENAKGPVL